MMNRLKNYARFIHGFQVYRLSHVDSGSTSTILIAGFENYWVFENS
jgi:hypothetical protein